MKQWIDFGMEHQLVDSEGRLLARVHKNGCCWYASIGENPASSSRFSRLEDAKAIVEKLIGN